MEISDPVEEIKFIKGKTLLATTRSTMHYSNLYQTFNIRKQNEFNRWMGKRILVDSEGDGFGLSI